MAGRERDGRSRPGRLRPGEREEREQAILDATLTLLVEQGWPRCTMAAIARQAGASKETLYRWFGDKDALLTALIHRESARTNAGVQAALDTTADPVQVLTEFSENLLRLLLGPRSIAINRATWSEAAGTDGRAAEILLREGRHRTGAIVERYLERLAAAGSLPVVDPGAAFQLLYGLVIQDLQIRALLGDDDVGDLDVEDHARRAVARFFAVVRAEA